MLSPLLYVATDFHAYYYKHANILIDLAVSQAHPAVKRLVEMGFVEADCRKALLLHKGAPLGRSLFLCLSYSLFYHFLSIYLLLAFLRYYDDFKPFSN